MNDFPTNYDRYRALAAAIILLQAQDYLTALRREQGRHSPITEYTIHSIEQWFHGPEFAILNTTDLDPDAIIKGLKERAREPRKIIRYTYRHIRGEDERFSPEGKESY